MPGSFEAENTSALNVTSSLRNFRFNNKPKSYQPLPSNSTSNGESSQFKNSNVKQGNCINTNNYTQATSSVSKSVYSPLGYRKYEVSNSKLLLPRIISKIHDSYSTASSNAKLVQVNFTSEELKKVKDVISPKFSEKWSANAKEIRKSLSGETNFEFCKRYLIDLCNFLSSVIVADASVSKESIKQPVRTYSRPASKAQNAVANNCVKLGSCNVPPNESHQLELKKSKGIMDDYEVFCGKELNLRKLLDAFPGADIMEAQDILVRCEWDLNKALDIAHKQPLRCPKKRTLSSGYSSPSESASSPASVKNQMPSTSRAEEIVLDSSDEDSIGVKSNSKTPKRPFAANATVTPAPKRVRRISSSESEDSQTTSSQQTNGKPTPTATMPNVTFQNVEKVEKPLSVPSSVSIKPVSASSLSNGEKSSKSAVPNLPKGLTLVPILSESPPPPDITSKTVTNSVKVSGITLPINDDLEVKPSVVKSAQLVRITTSGSTLTNQSGTSYTLPKHSSLNITPLPKGVSIMPIPKVQNDKDKNDYDADDVVIRESSKLKRKKYDLVDDEDEDYGNDVIFDSDDSDIEDNLTSTHVSVLKFFQESSVDELGCIPGCSKKKVEAVVNSRPYNSWSELVAKLGNDKFLSTELLNGAKKVLDMRSAISKLMTKCQQISIEMEDLVENLKDNKEKSSGYISKQPLLINKNLHLTSYQMLGINWLHVMHNQEVNGILADEMGLGKTIQAIAFLAYLKEVSISGPHLIVVPSSVMDNWQQELLKWWPDVSIICYHGSQDTRKELRMQILNDEVDEFDVMITTYNMIAKCAEDRGFFKRLEFHYVVFDEAHMLKNMASQRYQHLMKIKAPRRLLLTGTPLQNNLVELMSLLIFAMPHMFSGKTDQIKQMFSVVSKTEGNKNTYEKDRIEHAKRIMKPFVLRRLKKDVLQDLPKKHDEIRRCPMTEDQAEKYIGLVETFSAQVQGEDKEGPSTAGMGMMMQLRRAANHPLLLRRFFDDDKLTFMAEAIKKEPNAAALPNFEDMLYMSDFELHRLCTNCKSLKSFTLSKDKILSSGKFNVLDELLPDLKAKDHRVLLFSQFTMVLDIIEAYMQIKKYKFLRLDGQIPVTERQDLIDTFNKDPSIFIFLLSTKAGGLGINLTAADTVILHDIDFNPYNDKQAEDRCHRVGQTKDVTVMRLISENTIEEGILQKATEKLKLERDIHQVNENGENDPSVAKLLRDYLNLKNVKS